MNENVIVPECIFSTVLIDGLNAYGMDIPAQAPLKTGAKYAVTFDGQTFTCIGQDISSVLTGATAIGNGISFGFAGNSEPFVVISNPAYAEFTVLSLLDTGPSEHTLSISEQEEQQEGIVLLDYKDEPTVYYGKETLQVPSTVEGKSVNYIREDLVPGVIEDIPVALNFSNGDQTITAPEGMAVKSAIIQKPETLTPGNIAEGVDIAGVIGALAGGNNVKIASGKVATTAGPQTIEHNLGVIPDIVMLTTDVWDMSYPRVRSALGISKAFANLCGYNFCFHTYESSASSFVSVSNINQNGLIDVATSGPGIYNATETQFTLGSSQYKVNANSQWVAIGGLT